MAQSITNGGILIELPEGLGIRKNGIKKSLNSPNPLDLSLRIFHIDFVFIFEAFVPEFDLEFFFEDLGT